MEIIADPLTHYLIMEMQTVKALETVEVFLDTTQEAEAEELELLAGEAMEATQEAEAEAERLILEIPIQAAEAAGDIMAKAEQQAQVEEVVEMAALAADVSHKAMQLIMAEAAELVDLKVEIQTTVAMAIKV
jgi:allophanate hydrolase subunit 1